MHPPKDVGSLNRRRLPPNCRRLPPQPPSVTLQPPDGRWQMLAVSSFAVLERSGNVVLLQVCQQGIGSGPRPDSSSLINAPSSRRRAQGGSLPALATAPRGLHQSLSTGCGCTPTPAAEDVALKARRCSPPPPRPPVGDCLHPLDGLCPPPTARQPLRNRQALPLTPVATTSTLLLKPLSSPTSPQGRPRVREWMWVQEHRRRRCSCERRFFERQGCFGGGVKA